MTGINENPSGIIGKPIYIGSNNDNSCEFSRYNLENSNDLDPDQRLLRSESMVTRKFRDSPNKLFVLFILIFLLILVEFNTHIINL